MDVLAPDQLPLAAQLLRTGRLVAMPTPRWYMLCARATDFLATRAIFHVKQRPETKPLLLLLDSTTRGDALFDLSDDARLLMEHLWPGDLALRLPWKPGAEPIAAVGSPALVGCPDGILGRLFSTVGEPLAAAVCSISTPAAGVADHPALTVAQVAAFDRRAKAGIAAVVDGGICPHGRHLTVVDCPVDAAARVHREGTVHARAVEAALTPTGGARVG
ncbi:Sua5/YciO/YrdC/YwlC family protein [Streptomyces sp. NPDC004959]|uniref:Sua5/YciO/YrdC/YwlC family protein n=1 Tax=unclassified Streptomyces TaxID=2593676 RepID=UPI0004CA19B1|nr:Sua5/YciO/YrdC/YwlC family protein [Streptomyces sp. NRRL F-5630]